MDARQPETRVSKALAFFRDDGRAACCLFPRPWRLGSAPYYLVEGIENTDRRGGYSSICRFDADGVPYMCNGLGSRAYHPLVVARYVLRMFSLGALTRDPDAYAAAERAAVALAMAGAATGTWGAGRTRDEMGARVPSCIIQASAISALVRVGRHSPGLIPRDVIERAVEVLLAPASAGGTVTDNLGGPFFEEFETRSHVLNGCVYALWALYDAIDGMGWSDLKPSAQAVESCLAHVVPRFTTASGWSRYALDTYGFAPLASVDYHRSHIRMFTLLNARTGLTAYGDAAERWSQALNSPSTRYAALARKCAQVVWMRDVRRLPLAHSIWQ